MAGVIGIDEDWKLVTHYDSWLDSRYMKYVDTILFQYQER
jgi:hypothetical protein